MQKSKENKRINVGLWSHAQQGGGLEPKWLFWPKYTYVKTMEGRDILDVLC